MANLGSFEDYKKNSLLNVSPLQNQDLKNKSSNTLGVDPIVSFLGSKTWVDINLDWSYFQLEQYHSTCLQFCYNTNLNEHIKNLKEDSERGYGMACLINCLRKMQKANHLVMKSVESNPFVNRHFNEFSKIEEEVRNFNIQTIKKNYSF